MVHGVLCAAGAVLSLIGFMDSLYFSVLYYGRKRSGCTVSKCESVLDTPYAAALGIPNFLLGMPFYALIAIAASLSLSGSSTLLPYAFVAAFAAVLFSAYLVYGLVKLRMSCKLCYLAHGINAALVVLLGLTVALQ